MMVCITVGNVIFYLVSISKKNDHVQQQRVMKILSGFYVLGCGFRAVLPRIDVERICFVDTWLSCTFIGRCFATVAELSFMAQLMITLYYIADDVRRVAGEPDCLAV
jgi:hypothetical protein